MLALLLSTVAAHSEEKISGDWTYTVNKEGEGVLCRYSGSGAELDIPAKIDGIPIKHLGAGLFENKRAAEMRVVLPEGLESIGEKAFFDSGLKEIKLPEGLKSIGDHAFVLCGIESIRIPVSVTNIGTASFQWTGLTSLAIPSGVTSIGGGAFGNCAALSAIDVDEANANFTSFDGVLFDKGRKTLVQFPSGKQGRYTIPEGVESIARGAFVQCDKLTGLTIPPSIAAILEFAFSSCRSLESFSVDPSNPNFTSVDGVLFDKDRKTLVQFPLGRVGDYTIPEGVNAVASSAFRGATVAKVSIPSSVTNIGKDAFGSNKNLTNVVMPEALIGSVDSFGLAKEKVTMLKSVAEELAPNPTPAAPPTVANETDLQVPVADALISQASVRQVPAAEAEQTAVLKEPVKFGLVVNGKRIGETKVAAGTKVHVVKRDALRVLVRHGNAEQQWLDRSLLSGVVQENPRADF